jgi:hypothetical protein
VIHVQAIQLRQVTLHVQHIIRHLIHLRAVLIAQLQVTAQVAVVIVQVAVQVEVVRVVHQAALQVVVQVVDVDKIENIKQMLDTKNIQL